MPLKVTAYKPFSSRSALSIVSCYSDGAGTYYVDISAMFRLGQTNLGIQAQTQVSSCTVSYCMVPIDEAKAAIDAGNGATLPWHSAGAVAPGNIVTTPVVANYARLVFAAEGVCHLGAA